MINLKIVNEKINEVFPFIELVNGNGYFYFIAKGDDEFYSLEHDALAMMETTSVFTQKISDLSLEAWVNEAIGLYTLMILESDALKQKIEDKMDINKFIEMAKNWNTENEEIDCDITLEEDNSVFKAYTVSVCSRGLMFYTDKACLNYTIDTIGLKDYLVLESIEYDE